MSPTTLYREGADLDELLAELDSEHPGRVQVIEVTHPREGGVLGFFAKQRVGVHYRLADATPALSAPLGRTLDGFVAALGAAGAPTEQLESAFGQRSAAQPRATVALGPDATTLEAARFGRAGTLLAERPAPTPETSVTAEHIDTYDAPAPVARRAAPQGAEPTLAVAEQPAATPQDAGPTDFGELLADLAVRKAATTAGVVDSASALRELLATNAARRASAATAPGATPLAEKRAPLGDQAPTSPGAQAADSGGQRAPARDPERAVTTGALPPQVAAAAERIVAHTPNLRAETAPEAAPVPAATPAPIPAAIPTPEFRESGDQPAAFTPVSFGTAPSETVRPAFTDLPRVSADGASLLPSQRSSEADELAAAAMASEAPPAPSALTGRVSMSELPWSIGKAAAATPTSALVQNGTATSPILPPASTTPSPVAQPAIPAAPAAGPKLVLSRRRMTASGSTEPETSRKARASYAARSNAHATPAPGSAWTLGAAPALTPLQRRLAQVGVAPGRMPTDAQHHYEAIEQLVAALPPAPALPTGTGRIMLLLGATSDVARAADDLIAQHPGAFTSVWCYGCGELGAARRSTDAQLITSAEHAAEIASVSRATATGTTLIVVATGGPHAESATDVVRTIDADAVWATVDATRKTTDSQRELSAFRIDGLIVTRADASASPATVWDLDVPIAVLDGRPSSGPAWAVLLLDKLSAAEAA